MKTDGMCKGCKALLRARTKERLDEKRARGEKLGGHAPIGFRVVDGRLVPEPAEQAILRDVRALRRNGLSLQLITDMLNIERKTLRGGRIHMNTLSRALRRERAA